MSRVCLFCIVSCVTFLMFSVFLGSIVWYPSLILENSWSLYHQMLYLPYSFSLKRCQTYLRYISLSYILQMFHSAFFTLVFFLVFLFGSFILNYVQVY